MRWRRWLKRVPEVLFIGAALFALGLECSVPATGHLADENPTSTAFIDLRRGQAEAAGKKWKLQWQWRRLGQISRYLRAAVVFSEDINFYTHDGVDWGAMWKAIHTDLGGGSVGGSTITQQLAKNLYLSPTKSVLRKAREMLIAFSLEDHLTKQRILELYLNVVEWGDGIFGAEAASQRWFGHSAQALTPVEAARLAVALPNPYTRAPNVRSAELTTKAARLVAAFALEGIIDGAQEKEAFAELGVLAPEAEKVKADVGKEGPKTKLGDEVDDDAKPEPAKPEPNAEPGKEPKPEPGKPEPGKPESGKPESGSETEPTKPEPEPTKPEPAKPEPEVPKPEPAKPEPTPEPPHEHQPHEHERPNEPVTQPR